MSGKLENYGCAGRERFDFSAKMLGHPVDDIDHALKARSLCLRCVGADYASYDFDEVNESCANAAESSLRLGYKIKKINKNLFNTI